MTAPEDAGRAGEELLDVVVIGGSQAGLAMAWHLAQRHLRFAVLEAGPEIGHGWQSRWDSLTLFTPAQHDALPGMAFPGPPDTYPGKDAVAGYLRAYAAAFDLPVKLNARVSDLSRTEEGFEIRTQVEVLRARQVVVATGPFQVPFMPPAPQRLAGKDLFWWLTRLGLMRVTAGSRLGQRMSSREFIIGSSRRRLKAAAVRFRPAVAGADGRTVRFADGTSLDAAGVIWATGYRSDYSWIHIPGVVGEGKVVHRRGVTEVPGLYFVGLSWQHTRGSALLGFVNDDAAYLAGRITSQARATKAAASSPASQRSA